MESFGHISAKIKIQIVRETKSQKLLAIDNDIKFDAHIELLDLLGCKSIALPCVCPYVSFKNIRPIEGL